MIWKDRPVTQRTIGEGQGMDLTILRQVIEKSSPLDMRFLIPRLLPLLLSCDQSSYLRPNALPLLPVFAADIIS